ncbi:hypothetical protein BGZ61DRAFT_341508 [Ilyonectria robusta]|uniref:uncharacterized protein n=1 Tax=Ilyonectria robusta TaxID=1079257 RepID=UPI001E8D2CB0|nr:uncharacterized protein BGZ61DRAFT_341508 [Ilyonectria robusta]KAH8736386.1 hypothetical protein BGZ61DRAFT_341508 [Ilyonectria robusta]
MDSTTGPQQPWFLQSSYPVLFPAHDALRQSQADFETFIRQDLSRRHDQTAADAPAVGEDKDMTEVDESETFTLVTDSTSAEIRRGLDHMQASQPSHPFMDALLNADKKQEEPARNLEGMMSTENGDLAFRSTNDALVDLFTELEEVVSGPRLMELLNAAWGADPLATLKIIFNARSIHLGKSSKRTFYRCAGWLAQNHPLTLVANLRWLSRPVIEKKTAKKEGEDDIVIVDEKDDSDPTKFDVQYGVAHGYWKDLLNILALAANNKLDVLSNPRDVLNTENPGISQGKSARRASSRARGRGGRGRGGSRGRMTRDQRHEAAVNAFNTNPVYRALHLTIARLFSEQLEVDLRALRGDDAKAKRNISLCGKWAPSHDRFHDKHTFIVSSIAEILYPRDSLDEALSPTDDRETYLRHAREQYRKDTSALRKQLDIVERNLSANTIKNIKYDRVPSIAMSNYSKLFIQKDLDGFEKYIDRVAEGKANISGATLLPSTLLYKAKTQAMTIELTEERKATMSPEKLVQAKINAIEAKVVDGQWNALVQRIKDSGNLENSLAVCDVSGSMGHPIFPDKTCPMDSAIGLSLLIAEVTKPPFGGSFITFSSDPEVVKLDLSKPLVDKYLSMSQAEWGMSTDFVAVFERLILPIAISNSLKQEDMVKRVFVFSDMQFNDAGEDTYNRRSDKTPWATSFERIKKKFEDAGYELPELVFWNLAGGRSGYGGQWGDPVAPKPVTSTEDGTCLVSGYSQGMLKVFLDNGAFEDPEEEEDSEDEIVISKDGDEVTQEKPKKKAKMDPMAIVKKAIGHKAYDMLQVVD